MVWVYEGVSKSFQTGHMEWELQMVQLSATRCSFIAILWNNLMSFGAITLCIASKWVFIVVSVYFVIDSAWKLLDIPSYTEQYPTLSGIMLKHSLTSMHEVTDDVHTSYQVC
jgi:hypothetical protein